MERSIDSARRKRTLSAEPMRRPEPMRGGEPGSTGAAWTSGGGGTPASPPSPVAEQHPLQTESGGRLKARPKRPQNAFPPRASNPYSQAG